MPEPQVIGSLQVAGFALGDFLTNCYVVSPANAASDEPPPAWIIDAGYDPEPLIEHVRLSGVQAQAIVLTHAHVDHIAGLAAVRAALGELPIWIHGAERAFLQDPALNLSAFLAEPVEAPDADETFEHGQTLQLGPLSFEVRHTPGHSPGGVTLYQPDSVVAFVGDALFAGGVGRTDFPYADHGTLIQRIREQLLSLPDAVRIFPGHGPDTTIGEQRATNPFLQ